MGDAEPSASDGVDLSTRERSVPLIGVRDLLHELTDLRALRGVLTPKELDLTHGSPWSIPRTPSSVSRSRRFPRMRRSGKRRGLDEHRRHEDPVAQRAVGVFQHVDRLDLHRVFCTVDERQAEIRDRCHGVRRFARDVEAHEKARLRARAAPTGAPMPHDRPLRPTPGERRLQWRGSWRQR